ncbi:MAG: hypothetical protein ACRCT1_12445 [Microcoleaceae cyanobacterium]|jgi:hypothetical protein
MIRESKEEARSKKQEGRGKKEEERGKKEEARRRKARVWAINNVNHRRGCDIILALGEIIH